LSDVLRFSKPADDDWIGLDNVDSALSDEIEGTEFATLRGHIVCNRYVDRLFEFSKCRWALMGQDWRFEPSDIVLL
jgi:hypothetical protein